MGKLETSGIRPIVIKEITEFAKEYGLKEVILFGSRARGDYERASDIDLAVRNGRIDEFTIAVKEETSTLLDFDVIETSEGVKKELTMTQRWPIRVARPTHHRFPASGLLKIAEYFGFSSFTSS